MEKPYLKVQKKRYIAIHFLIQKQLWAKKKISFNKLMTVIFQKEKASFFGSALLEGEVLGDAQSESTPKNP